MDESYFRRNGRGQEGRESMGGLTRWPGKAERPFKKGQEELGGPPGGPGWVDRPSRWARRGQDALPQGGGKCREAILEVREWLGGPPRGPGGVGTPSWRNVRSPPGGCPQGGPGGFRKDRRCREALSVGWEGFGGPPKGLGGVAMPIQRARVVGIPTKRPRGAGSPFWRAGKGRESLQESQEGFGGLGEVGSLSWGLEGVTSPSQTARMGWEALQVCQDGSRVLPGGLGVVRRPSRRVGGKEGPH